MAAQIGHPNLAEEERFHAAVNEGLEKLINGGTGGEVQLEDDNDGMGGRCTTTGLYLKPSA